MVHQRNWWIHSGHEFIGFFTASFNNKRTLKFKAQPTNGFFATVNQMFSSSSQLPTTDDHCFVVWTVLNDLITSRSAVVESWKESPNIWLTVAKNAFVGWALNFRLRVLLKCAVKHHDPSDLGSLILIQKMRRIELPYLKVGDARRKIWMKSLKEINLGVARALFDP